MRHFRTFSCKSFAAFNFGYFTIRIRYSEMPFGLATRNSWSHGWIALLIQIQIVRICTFDPLSKTGLKDFVEKVHRWTIWSWAISIIELMIYMKMFKTSWKNDNHGLKCIFDCDVTVNFKLQLGWTSVKTNDTQNINGLTWQ